MYRGKSLRIGAKDADDYSVRKEETRKPKLVKTYMNAVRYSERTHQWLK